MQGKHFVLRVCLCLCVVALVFASLVQGEEKNGTSPSLFEVSQIVPDVLDKPPEAVLEALYRYKPLTLGQELTPEEATNQPDVSWDADPDLFYTLLMIHPDAPLRRNPTFREIRAWLVVNIPGKNVSAGEVISAYLRPLPTEGTGLHRYVILLFRQPEKLVFDEHVAASPRDFAGRLKVSTRAFAKKYGLGDPVAGTFFEAEWDETVPRLYEQLDELRKAGFDLSQFQ